MLVDVGVGVAVRVGVEVGESTTRGTQPPRVERGIARGGSLAPTSPRCGSTMMQIDRMVSATANPAIHLRMVSRLPIGRVLDLWGVPGRDLDFTAYRTPVDGRLARGDA